jgi:thymidylate synthase (FAD)
MLIKRGHTSVLEHAYATFRISGISRVLTHQLVRHRFCSITQQSQRYIDEKSFHYIEPSSIKSNSEAHVLFINLMERIRNVYIELKNLGIKKEDARFVLPNATESQLVLTANLREWRHIIELRGDLAAQWEIRKMVIKILKILKQNIPTVFEDFKIIEEKNIIQRLDLK